MSIVFDEKNQNFNLSTKDTSYIIHLAASQFLQHVYWGKRLNNFGLNYLLRYFNSDKCDSDGVRDELGLDVLPQEYPSYGIGDLRSPAYQVCLENGSTVTDARYKGHCIYSGKKALEGLPASYAEDNNEAQTLEIELKDDLCGLKILLSYTVFENYNVIARSVRFINEGNENLKLLRTLSANVDFDDYDFDMLQLSGAWAREFDMIKRPLVQGSQLVESRRGASSAQQNPFVALMRKNADEDTGDVYGFSFVYSGNFLANIEVAQFGSARVQMGINPFDFGWLLKPQETFQCPETIMVYSDAGLGNMSRIYHRFYRQRLCRGTFRDKERPILINNWEGTYFDFTETKLKDIASEASKVGIELFVLDDGWFGHRDNDRSSLGDWQVDLKKLPNGLDNLAKSINQMGLKFGLWFEPEMVSPDSDLYRAHPDWCLHIPGRDRTLRRHQLVLDFSREDVCEAITKMIIDTLSTVPIAYVKWDMNRNMSEVGSALLEPERQRETAHRYMLGLYKVLDTITSSFPDILFESCASGGGRFDAGMLYYMPQTWTSDDTDAIERLKIQYGASLVYPIITMSSHVSAVPNHQVSRITSLTTRANTAMSGNLGFELDLTKMTAEDKEKVKEHIKYYKQIRKTVQFGDLYRLKNPSQGNEAAWMFISQDKTEAIVNYFKILSKCNYKLSVLKLKGLDANKRYKIDGTTEIYGGDELMYAGLIIPELKGDFQSCSWRLKEIDG